jgi:hypothetical protein
MIRASEQSGDYPRPQLVREPWVSLDGEWEFGYDDADIGVRDRWFDLVGGRGSDFDSGHASRPGRGADAGAHPGGGFDRTVMVPFPPESPASGIGDPSFHPVVWYRRALTTEALTGGAPIDGSRVVVHFGAVDYEADVWFDGEHLARHVGGQTPFEVDVTDVLLADSRQLAPTDGDGPDRHVLVVRAKDDPIDPAQPRGKQDWEPIPHGIWYERTTGIWQTVWCEVVPSQRIAELVWIPSLAESAVTVELSLAESSVVAEGSPATDASPSAVGASPVVAEGSPATDASPSAVGASPVVAEGSPATDASPSATADIAVTIQLRKGGELIGVLTQLLTEKRSRIAIPLAVLSNPRTRSAYVWSPEQPVLLDAEVWLHPSDDVNTRLDEVASYFGMRSVAVGDGHFLLNDEPYYVRAVLGQGYWPDSHLSAPTPAALRDEVVVIKALGFNTVRVHQKAENPRFLFHADVRGLLVWGETASAREFSTDAMKLLTSEWIDIVRRDRSHPCIVAWVPINESWGVEGIANGEAQRQFAAGIAALTRALDPTRPAMSNEGWEHVDSDILGVHDYTGRPGDIVDRYRDERAVHATLNGRGPLDRRLALTERQRASYEAGRAPLMITEFGGISYAGKDTWGYSIVTSDDEFEAALRAQFDAVQSCPPVVGFCYTQLTDTRQEANGLLTGDRQPKLPIDVIAAMVTAPVVVPPPVSSTTRAARGLVRKARVRLRPVKALARRVAARVRHR